MAGPSRFKKNADKRPKRNTQTLLFKRKRYCRFTVADVETQPVGRDERAFLRDVIAQRVAQRLVQ